MKSYNKFGILLSTPAYFQYFDNVCISDNLSINPLLRNVVKWSDTL